MLENWEGQKEFVRTMQEKKGDEWNETIYNVQETLQSICPQADEGTDYGDVKSAFDSSPSFSINLQ